MKTTNMKQIVALVLLLAFSIATAEARSWRINNDITKNPDFASINAAMDCGDVVAGDTLYLDPGCSLTTDQTVSKQVTIMGCGYFRSDLPYSFASVSGKLYITAPFAKVESTILNGNVFIRSANVTLERCCVTDKISVGEGSTYQAQNAVIRQCWAKTISGSNNQTSVNCTIENCILILPQQELRGTVINGLVSPIIKNNYIYITKDSYNSGDIYAIANISKHTVVNNIIINTSKSGSGHIFYKCTDALSVQYNLMSNNTEVTVSESSIFTLTGNNDERYQLKDDSPAKGYAADGSDIGPFAGNYPYVLSGLPAGHPYYTKATISPRSNNDKVKVSLKIKMQNE